MNQNIVAGRGGNRFIWLIALLLVALGLGVRGGRAADTLISTGAVWRFLDNGSNQGTNWQRPEFDDSAWTNGPAQLGFGDGDEATIINGGPAAARFVTIYFRRAFAIDDPLFYTNLQVRFLRDDGGVVYLNGVEIFRSNMPTNAILHTTLASASAAAADETTNFLSSAVSPALLRAGTNVVAAEVHQNSVTSSDLSFDLALAGNFANVPPTVALTAPANTAAFKPGTNLTLTATATDPDNGVARVEFYAGTTLLGFDSTSPYSLVWSNVLEGAYALTAVATDGVGASSTSAVVNIAVVTNLPPAVAITTPTNNAVFGGPLDVTVTATASDSDGGVSLVEFFVGGIDGTNKIGEAASAPFSAIWSNAAFGLYTLTAVASDLGGASRTSAPVRVTVRTNALPVVSLAAPRTNATLSVFSNVVLVASATDSDGGIRKVEFYEDGHLLGEDAVRKTNNLYSFSWLAPAPGGYTLRAVATDLAGGMRTSAPVSITLVTNLLPVVAITNPPNNGSVSARAPVVLQVSATDADGGISLVELFQAGLKIAEATAPPFDFVLTNLTPGHYTFRARTTDNVGDSAVSTTVNVTLHNRVEFVSKGSIWKYLATNASQGTGWRDLNYDDSFWPAGRAQLGYGDGDEATVVPFGPDANNKFITTYFRHSFQIDEATLFSNLTVRLLRDDGGVVYLNGTEVFRSNMPTNDILYSTLAPANALAEDETNNFYARSFDAALLRNGPNVLAVEVHQSTTNSSDMTFDAELSGADAASILRGPYLQLGTPTSVVVRWRTDALTDSRVRYGSGRADLSQFAGDAIPAYDHIVTLTGLAPDTTYYYDVGTSEVVMAGGIDYVFTTAPVPGRAKPTRIWVLGDSGTGDNNARAVRDAYSNFTDSRAPDLWLMLGDNAYNNGTEEEFQNALFDMFPTTLKRSVLWPIMSNHDTALSTNPPLTIPHFLNFTLPTNGEAGGFPSGTEKYYSFDYGDAHFVCLDSQTSLNSTNAPMLTWLREDLARNQRNWLIVTCANPPYGRVGNNSDTMPRDVTVRNYVLPILEAYGADLFFAGDDHAYERSYLMNGHYGLSSTLADSMILDHASGDPNGTGAYDKHGRGPAPHRGTVYVVTGSAGHLDPVPATTHPVNFQTKVVLGSVVLDVTDGRLDVRFLDANGVIGDHFAIVKDNHDPVATTLDLTTDEDHRLIVPLGGTDREGAPLDFTVLSALTNGVAWVLDGGGAALFAVTNGTIFPTPTNLLYQPATNRNGVDSLVFKASDGFNDSPPAVITITVTPINDPPVARAGTNQTVGCVGLHTVVVLDGSASSDVEDADLRFVWSEAGVVLGTNRIQSVFLAVGTHNITLEVRDADGASSEDTVELQVTDAGPPQIFCPTNIVVDFIGSTGAMVGFTITATDVCSVVSIQCAPPAGSLFRIGTSLVTCVATDTSSNRASCGFTITVRGALGVEQSVQMDLDALRLGVTNHTDADRLDDARHDLAEALEPALWIDETHLMPKHGDRVFKEGKDAVKELMEMARDRRSSVPAATLHGIIARLVKAARLLAVVSVQEAAAAGAKPKKIAEDWKEVDKGDEDAAEGCADDALDHYRNAWKHAVRLQVKKGSVQPGGSSMFLHFIAFPGDNYLIQASTNLLTWITLGPATADAEGEIEFEDRASGSHPTRYYRVISP